MDKVYTYNKERWEALVKNRALFTKPWLDLDSDSARQRLDQWNVLGDVNNKNVLCLAGGGGQQSAAFALLGAEVSVFDISEGQLGRDREAAERYGLKVNTFQGDMRDLSVFENDTFDIVWHPYSLNFVPDCREVFSEVSRILKPRGLYHFMTSNPFAAGMGTKNWNGEGYMIHRRYIEGEKLEYDDEWWVFRERPEAAATISGPVEYRQTLGRILNGLAETNFVVFKMVEWAADDQNPDAEPGSWEHFTSHIPPWFGFWARHYPDLEIGND